MMAPSTYNTFLVATIIACAILWGFILPQKISSRDANWAAGMYNVKENGVRVADTRKMILLSGSSGLFGLSGKSLTSRLRIPVINFSVHKGLGIKYLLYRARKVLRSEDFVFMALEYGLLKVQDTPGQILVNFVSAKDPGYIAEAPNSWLPYFFSGHDHKSLIWALVEWFGVWSYKQSCYGSAATLNAFGDETCGETDVFETGNLKLVKESGPIPVETINPLEIDPSIAEFLEWARSNGIKVIIGFPPLLDHPHYLNPTYKRAFAKLRARLLRFGVEVIGKPEDFLYPIKYMHDTRYHLHSKARDIHTKKIEAKLCSGIFRCQ